MLIMISKLITLFFLCFLLVLCYSDTIIRPRGVPLSMISLYPTEGTFTCFDGSLSIPFDQINDDYCDCEMDGSDEPGTSACPNGSFYCNNVGHKSMFIPSSQVNDGICDCCDGSDEYARQDVVCGNNCLELGQAAREEEARKIAMFKEGSKLRTELCFKGKQIKREKQLRLLELVKEQTEAENMKNEKEELKLKVEKMEKEALDVYKEFEDQKRKEKEEEERIKNEEEAMKYFKQADKNSDGVIDKNEIKMIDPFDQNQDNIISEEEIKTVFGEEEKLSFETFLSTSWEYIKQIFAARELKQNPATDFKKQHFDETVDDEVKKDDKSSLTEETYYDNEEEEEQDEDKDDAQQLETESERDSNTEDDSKPKYDEETKNIIEAANSARSEYDNAVRNLRDVQREIKQIEETLNKDYGKDDEFAYLVGECYEYANREYIYKLCPFDQVSQRPKDGGIETRLGTWGYWINDKYELMLFENGQNCWNGPQRQTHVKLNCNLQTEIVAASEPSRCEYLLEFNTPAACSWKESRDTGTDYHDEL